VGGFGAFKRCGTVDVTLPMLESMRRRVRGLVKLIEKTRRGVIYSDFEDQLGALTESTLRGVALGTNRNRFEAKVRTYLRSHEDQIAVQKLRRNRQITTLDLRWFEDAFVEFGFGTHQDVELVATEYDGLGIYLRSLTGLDREAASAASTGSSGARTSTPASCTSSTCSPMSSPRTALLTSISSTKPPSPRSPAVGRKTCVPRDGGRRDRQRASRRSLDSYTRRGGGLSTPVHRRKGVQPTRCRCCTGMDRQPRQRRAPQRALALAFAEPEVVQITAAQYRQAVNLLASMIVSYVEQGRPEHDRD
jgi:hypothetical protein